MAEDYLCEEATRLGKPVCVERRMSACTAGIYIVPSSSSNEAFQLILAAITALGQGRRAAGPRQVYRLSVISAAVEFERDPRSSGRNQAIKELNRKASTGGRAGRSPLGKSRCANARNAVNR